MKDLHLHIIAKADNRAWVVYCQFRDDPIDVIELQDGLPEGTEIARCSVTAWTHEKPFLVAPGRKVSVAELQKALALRARIEGAPVEDAAQ
jgi:hypothetical protein